MSSSAVLSLAVALRLLLDQHTPPVLGEVVSRPFLAVTGLTLLVAGETLEIYEYPTNMEIERDIRALALDAKLWTGGGGHVPYGFRKGQMMVLYAGHQQQVVGWVTRVLGPCFLRP